MIVSTIKPTESIIKTSSSPSIGYTVRCTFPFDAASCKYSNTDKPIQFKGRPMEQFRLDSFWKQVHTSCEEFCKLKRYSKVSPYSFNTGILLLFLGVIILVLGVIPIWGKEPQNLKCVIAAGVIIIFSLVQFMVARSAVRKYLKSKLFPKYQEFITKAVFEHFEDELHRGLHWRGGRDGFKCIEFWSIVEDRHNSTRLETSQVSKFETNMYTDTADLLKRDASADRSALEIKNFFKESDNQSSLFETHRSQQEPLSCIRLRPVETERDLQTPDLVLIKNESEILTAKGLLEDKTTSTAMESTVQEAEIKNLKNIKEVCGAIVTIASSTLKSGDGYVNMESQQEEDLEKGL